MGKQRVGIRSSIQDIELQKHVKTLTSTLWLHLRANRLIILCKSLLADTEGLRSAK